MKTVAVGDGVRLAGALGEERTADGVIPRRLPDWCRPQLDDPMLSAVVQMPSGCRLEFESTTDAVELDVMLSRFQFPPDPAAPAVFDLDVDGEITASVRTEAGNLLVVDRVDVTRSRWEPGAPTTIRFDGLGDAAKVMRLWLPHTSVVELRGFRVADDASTAAPQVSTRRWAHHGSSISHCMEALQPTGVWPVIAARAAGVDLINVGLAGSCHLDQFAARALRDAPVEAISIKAGINIVNGDTLRERTFGPALHGFLDTIREGKPSVPILVISPIICPPAEDHPGPTIPDAGGKFRVVPRAPELATGSLTLRRIRELMDAIVARRRALGDTNLHYLDGLSLFGPDDAADLPDDLHPSPDGYRRIAERFHRAAFVDGPFAAL